MDTQSLDVGKYADNFDLSSTISIDGLPLNVYRRLRVDVGKLHEVSTPDCMAYQICGPLQLRMIPASFPSSGISCARALVMRVSTTAWHHPFLEMPRRQPTCPYPQIMLKTLE